MLYFDFCELINLIDESKNEHLEYYLESLKNIRDLADGTIKPTSAHAEGGDNR